MRRTDLIPVALLVALGGFIAVQFARAPRRRTPPPAIVVDTTESVHPDPAPASTGMASVIAAQPTDVESEVRMSSAPPPRHDVSEVRRRLQLSEAGTYLGAMLAQLDSNLYRWPDRVADPIRVWVDPHPPLADWSERNPSIVRAAFREWEQTGIPVRFSFVVNAGDADVTVTWVEKFEADRIGHTRWIHDQHRWMSPGSSITLALRHPTAGPVPEEMMAGVARHEIGHVLGVPHSPTNGDIMYAQLTQSKLSNADRATVRLLYSVPAGSIRLAETTAAP